MTDVLDRLAALRPTHSAAEADGSDDVRRGRAALSRVRARRSGIAAAVLAIGGVTAVGVAAATSHAPASQTAHAPSVTTNHAPSQQVRLVDYTGKQQPGFTVTKVPAGWVLQGATSGFLDVARADDHSKLNWFTNKIVVMAEPTGQAPKSDTTRAVKVGAAAGSIMDNPGGGKTLRFPQNGVVLVVQLWDGSFLSDAQLAEFGAGVTVTSDAQVSVG